MAEIIRIIGIDPGLRNMGWGIIEFDGVRLSYVNSGTIKSDASAAIALRLKSLFDGLGQILGDHKPDEAAVEQTFVNKDAGATLKLGQARGVALLAPTLIDCPVSEYAPNQVKKTVTGAGHADKAQIRAMLSYLLPKATPDTDDAADALAIAICHAHNRRQNNIMAALGAR